MRTKFLMAALASLAFATGAYAQNTTATATDNASAGAKKTTSKNGSVSSGDRKFMQKAASDGMAEVQLGTLAKDKAASDEVKSFASRMVTDHGKANDQLKSLAASKGVDLPADTDKDHKKKMDKLGKLTGPDFDRAYMKDMVSDHKKDVSAFRKEAKGAKDADVKGFASQTLPTLEEHLAMAHKTSDVVQGSKRTGNRETGSTKK
jgi:Predicted outer membrane protein